MYRLVLCLVLYGLPFPGHWITISDTSKERSTRRCVYKGKGIPEGQKHGYTTRIYHPLILERRRKPKIRRKRIHRPGLEPGARAIMTHIGSHLRLRNGKLSCYPYTTGVFRQNSHVDHAGIWVHIPEPINILPINE